jgi:hypothetical protein
LQTPLRSLSSSRPACGLTRTRARGATEVLTVVQGEMYVGFLATDGTLFAKVMSKGDDVFVFPEGPRPLSSSTAAPASPSASIAGLSSQNPGLIRAADSLFGATSAVADEVLAKAVRIDAATVQRIKAQFATKKQISLGRSACSTQYCMSASRDSWGGAKQQVAT